MYFPKKVNKLEEIKENCYKSVTAVYVNLKRNNLNKDL